MLKKLSKSRQSSNFWNNVATIATGLAISAMITFVENPELLKSTSLISVVSLVFYNASNILYHINREK